MRSNRTDLIIVLSILFLFFLQVLSDFIQSIYAFGLLVTAFTIQLAAVLLLFTPLVLVFLRKPPSRPWLIGFACVAMLGRLLEPLLDPGGRLVACGVSVGAFMLLFPSVLAAGVGRSAGGWRPAWGLLIAAMLSILFRAAGSSLDMSEVSIYQVIAWVLAAVAVRLMWTLELDEMQPPKLTDLAKEARETQGESDEALSHQERRERSLQSLEVSGRNAASAAPVAAPSPPLARPRTGRLVGLCLGLASVITTLYFAFVSPTVMARWTAYSYAAIVIVLLFAWLGFALLVEFWPARIASLSRGVMLIWNALFVILLVLAILPQQFAFSTSPDSYPINMAPVTSLAAVPLFLMLILSPVIFADFLFYTRQISAERPRLGQLGCGFSLAALFFLVMVFLHVFTTIYDYAKPVGPLLRDRFWLVYLLAGLGLALPLFLVRTEGFPPGTPDVRPRLMPAIVGALAIFTIAALYFTGPNPSAAAQSGQLRVMTYNIQQGFDKVGAADLEGQLRAIQRVAPDVLGLEESDTARVSNGNVDAVRYFSDHLGMYSFYGPTTTVGTFGIALLSKYPIVNPQTFFLYSTAEQTACIQAHIIVKGKTYNVFVTHLGNDGPMIQMQNVLSRVEGQQNVVLVGDFNFDPSTPQYALAVEKLRDAWRTRWPTGFQLSGPGAEGRIDQIFVSPGTQVTDSEYVPDPSSDHPYLYAIIKP
ncbi:MAG TPA: endonuclease/exonuclease/phosphatase family protein [Anaerolineales bacterium]